ncbi:MAG: hypothetical protein ACT4QF_18930 [Sporichthyaceae bacterium]
MKNRKVVIPAAILAVYAMAQQPAQSADAVSKGWDQVTVGSGSVVEGFFTFVNRL